MGKFKLAFRDHSVMKIMALVFLVWSAAFIFRSSIVGMDGNRYFCLFDDAMISMRYGWNLSHGFGLVWNIGERIEGYTNLLTTLIMSFATLVFNKSIAALAMQLIGVITMSALGYLSIRIADHFLEDEPPESRVLARILSFTCVMFYYPLVYWSLMGMETGLLTVLVFLSILFTMRFSDDRRPPVLFLVSTCLGLAFLARNDSFVFAFGIFTFLFLEALKSDRKWPMLAVFLSSFFVYLLFVAGQVVFRMEYYGELLPNTYSLKLTGMSTPLRIRDGIGFSIPFLAECALPLLVVTAEVIFNFNRKRLLIYVLTLLAIAYQIWIGGDAFQYWRFFSPFVPLLLMVYIQAISAVVRFLTTTRLYQEYLLRNPIFPKSRGREALVVLFTLTALLAANVRFLPEMSLLIPPYQHRGNENNINTAIAINEVTNEDASVGVFWAGSIPYYTEREAVDFLGKADRYIAQLPADISGVVSWSGMRSVPGHNKYDLNYSIMQLQPTYVQGLMWGSQDLSESADSLYAKVWYKGIPLILLRNSPAVHWEKLSK